MKAVVAFSGGIDSTLCLYDAIKRFGKENVYGVGVYYGQKHVVEIHHASKIAKECGVSFQYLDISGVYTRIDCPLIEGSSSDIVHASYEEQISKNGSGPVSTYVPNRNMVIISLLGAYCGKFKDEECVIILGAQSGDSDNFCYPDCTKEFYDACEKCLHIATYGKVKLEFPLQNMTKAQIVKKCLEYNVPLQYTYSCYEGGLQPCGKCATCIERAKAFKEVGVKDPALEVTFEEVWCK